LYDDERSRKKVELPFLYIDNSTTRREAQLHIDWTLKLVFLLGQSWGKPWNGKVQISDCAFTETKKHGIL
jgi:hypothetical protein